MQLGNCPVKFVKSGFHFQIVVHVFLKTRSYTCNELFGSLTRAGGFRLSQILNHVFELIQFLACSSQFLEGKVKSLPVMPVNQEEPYVLTAVTLRSEVFGVVHVTFALRHLLPVYKEMRAIKPVVRKLLA